MKLSENNIIYAKLTYGTYSLDTIASLDISNIDKEVPIINSQLQVNSVTSSGFNVNIGVQDTGSGIGKIEWYYRSTETEEYQKTDDNYKNINGTERGSTKAESLSHSFTGLASGTYKIKAIIYDVSGNQTMIAEQDIQTLNVSALTTSDTTFTYNPSNWINENVTVGITTTVSGYTLQYSIGDTTNWNNYTDVLTITDNTVIYARLWDGINAGGYITGEVSKIDKVVPIITSQIQSSNVTTNSFDANIGVQDIKSGIAKIAWYYKNSTASDYQEEDCNYKNINGTEAGNTEVENLSHSFTGLISGTYDIRAIVYDVAGNQVTSADATINTLTLDTLTASNTTFTYSPSSWTNGNVTVGITTTISGYTLQYSIGNTTSWNNYTDVLTITDNTVIYARLWDGINAGGYATGEVSNIDKVVPTYTSYTINNITSSGYDVYVYGVSDLLSGINRVQFPTWTDNNGGDDLLADWGTNSSLTGTNQGNGTWYFRANVTAHNNESGAYNTHIYIYDNAGNLAFIPTTGASVPLPVPSAPTTLAATINNSAYLTATWDAPSSELPITSYTINIGGTAYSTTSTSYSLTYAVAGDVTISVSAINANGTGNSISHTYTITKSSEHHKDYSYTEYHYKKEVSHYVGDAHTVSTSYFDSRNGNQAHGEQITENYINSDGNRVSTHVYVYLVSSKKYYNEYDTDVYTIVQK